MLHSFLLFLFLLKSLYDLNHIKLLGRHCLKSVSYEVISDTMSETLAYKTNYKIIIVFCYLCVLLLIIKGFPNMFCIY